jgi:hypothetical protein
VQRAPKDPAHATDPIANVKGSGITRVKVDGLRFGQSSDFKESYKTSDGDVKSKEKAKTDESPIHTAILLVPDNLLTDQPIQVILHFHGWGFRSFDPYAGYLKGKDKGNTYRDVEQEHLEEQIGPLESQVAGGPPQIVGILAQGIGTSKFGDVPTFDFIRDVLEKSGRFPDPLPEFTVVLSAHSGGGSSQVVPDLVGGQADTSDRSQLAEQKPDAANQLAPVDLVVLFEALNNDTDVTNVVTWVDRQLDRLAPALENAIPGDESAKKALDATPKLRGYFGDRRSGYATRYKKLSATIADHISAKVADPWRQPVHDLFRIIRVTDPRGRFDPKAKHSPTVEHEEVIGGKGKTDEGSMAAALKASRDPTIDRAQDLQNEP